MPSAYTRDSAVQSVYADTYSTTAAVKPWPVTFKVPSAAPDPRCKQVVSQHRSSKMVLTTHVGHGKDSSTSLHGDIGSGTLGERLSELGVKACQGGKIGFDLIQSLDGLVCKLIGRVGGRTDSPMSRP